MIAALAAVVPHLGVHTLSYAETAGGLLLARMKCVIVFKNHYAGRFSRPANVPFSLPVGGEPASDCDYRNSRRWTDRVLVSDGEFVS